MSRRRQVTPVASTTARAATALPSLVCAAGQFLTAHAMAKTQVVADQRARAGLTPRHLRFHHHGAEPFRRGVDGCGQTCRSGTEDHEVAGRAAGPDRHPEFLDHVGVARIHQDVPGVEEHHRQSGAVLAGLGKGLAACLGLRFVEPEGNRGSGQQVADLVRPRGGGATDDPEGNAVGILRGVPGGEELADPGIEDPLQRKPGIEQVIVDLS